MIFMASLSLKSHISINSLRPLNLMTAYNRLIEAMSPGNSKKQKSQNGK